MARVRGKDTRPELEVRRLLHGLGYRYRLHARDLPGKPDIVLRARRKIILVHGCFWHRHPDPGCRLARLPKSRLDFWLPKLNANRDRDRRLLDELTGGNWRVLIVWECELPHKASLAARLQLFLGPPCQASHSGDGYDLP